MINRRGSAFNMPIVEFSFVDWSSAREEAGAVRWGIVIVCHTVSMVSPITCRVSRVAAPVLE